MKFFSLLAGVLLLAATSAQAAVEVFALTNNTARSLFTRGVTVENISVLASTSTNTTVKFYDSATTTTNYVQAAYTGYTSYSTNITQVFTNTAGILITNTISGTYRAPTAVALATNELTKAQILMVPGSSLLSRDVGNQLYTRGITAVSDQDCLVTITYSYP